MIQRYNPPNSALTESRPATWSQTVPGEEGSAERERMLDVLVSGSTGFIGGALLKNLEGEGLRPGRLVREGRVHENDVTWSPARGVTDPQPWSAEAVVHLAGEGIATGRWTAGKMQAIRDSRVEGTRRLCQSLAQAARPPAVLVCASAIGFYGNRGAELLDEDSAPGRGFLAETCQAWEEATRPAVEAGIRVVNLRTGIVLGAEGGALAKMLATFKLGLGGPLGSGSQFMSWIGLEDLVRAIRHAIDTPELHGPVNAVSPLPVTNAEFTRLLGRAVERPAFLPLPALAIRLLLGKAGDELFLASTRVKPAQLLSSGFTFRQPELAGFLAELVESHSL